MAAVGATWRDFLDESSCPEVLAFLERARTTHRRALLVGNGPVCRSASRVREIDRHPFVIRFNEFSTQGVGSKLDLHVLNHLCASRDGVATLDLSCPRNARSGAAFLRPVVSDSACRSDPTRGFFLVTILLALDFDVTLAGFGGVGHNDTNVGAGYIASMTGTHSMPEEHLVLRQLTRQRRIRLLTPIARSANTAMLLSVVVLFFLVVPVVIGGVVATVLRRRRERAAAHAP